METEVTIGKLSAKPRTTIGKGEARRTRAAGLIPCVVYGGGKPARSLTIDPKQLVKALDPRKGRNTVLALAVEGGETEKVMLKEYQRHPLKDRPLHADFIRVDLTKPVRVRVPLTLSGKAEGEKIGGELHRVFRDLEVECTPDCIPPEIIGEVTALQIGDSLTIGDLLVPAGVSICLPRQQTCALLMAPRKIEEEKPAEEAAAGAEGAAAAGEGAEEGKKPEEKKAE